MSDKDFSKLDLEAADWLVALNCEEDLSEEQFDTLASWIENPEAEDTLSRTETVWDLALLLENDPQVNSYRDEISHRQHSNWKDKVSAGKLFLAAACFSVVSFIGAYYHNESAQVADQHFVYQTATGERKTVKLPDNSLVTLNTASEIHVNYGLQYRNIILERGEALFKVKQDKHRPFKVFAEAGEITALGTVFDVRLRGDDSKHVDVALIEGKISVEKALPSSNQSANQSAKQAKSTIPKKLLSAGEQIVFSDTQMFDIETISDMDQVVSWKDGHLYFTNSPLSEIVAQVNRYTVSKLVIDDPTLKNERMSAYFNLDDGDNESLLFALKVNLNVKWYKKSGTTVLYRDETVSKKQAM
jgi:transmembrane sensor